MGRARSEAEECTIGTCVLLGRGKLPEGLRQADPPACGSSRREHLAADSSA